MIKPVLEQHLNFIDLRGPLGMILDTSLALHGLDRMVPIRYVIATQRLIGDRREPLEGIFFYITIKNLNISNTS